MTIYDVGQGDSIIFETKKGRILIDGGGNYEVDRYLRDLYWPLVKPSFDYIYLTHPHADHLVGLNRILFRDSRGVLTFNDVVYDGKPYHDFLELAEKNSVKKVFAGDIFSVNGITIRSYWPDEQTLQSTLDNVNNFSTVSLFSIGNFDALMTGDAEIEALRSIDFYEVSESVTPPLEVLKVPHHGSRTGLYKEMYEILKPIYCVISVGKDNSYKLPHQEVLDYLNTVGCKILRTDMDGSIKFFID